MSGQAKVTIVLEAVNRARAAFEQARNDVRTLSSQVQEANRRMVQTARLSLEQVKSLAAGFSGLVTTLWGFYAVYDRLGTQQRQLASLQASYNRTLVAYQSLQHRLNQALAKYGEGSEEVRLIRERLAATEERLRVYQIQIAEYQGNINETLVQGALLAFPMAVNAAASLSTAFKALSTMSATRLIPALRGVGLALRGALGPIGLILTAVGVLYAAWVQNWGGMRDATEQAVKAVMAALENLYNMVKPLLEPLVSALKGLGELLGLSLPDQVEAAGQRLQAFRFSANSASEGLAWMRDSVEGVQEVLPSFEAGIESVKGSVDGLRDSLYGASLEARRLFQELERAQRERISSLRRLWFEEFVRPSREFQENLAGLAKLVWDEMKTRGEECFETLEMVMLGFMERWGLTWTETLTLVEQKIRELYHETSKLQAVVQAEVGRPTPLKAEALRTPAEAVSEPRLTPRQLAQRMYAEQYARLMALALRAEQLGRLEEAAYWRRHAEASARAMQAVQLGTLTVNIHVDRVESPADEVRLAKRVGVEVVSQLDRQTGGI
ncbi:MAG: hypothetical protein ACXQTV_03595 [Candidatus Hecatellaceae archaeon]